MAVGGADGRERASQVRGRDGVKRVEVEWGKRWCRSGQKESPLNDEDELQTRQNCGGLTS